MDSRLHCAGTVIICFFVSCYIRLTHSAEAFAAALFIVGFKEDARTIMARFKWGGTFFQLNESKLEAYSKCKDGAEVTVYKPGNEIQSLQRNQQ